MAGCYYDSKPKNDGGSKERYKRMSLESRYQESSADEAPEYGPSLALDHQPSSPETVGIQSNRESWSSNEGRRTNVMSSSFSEQFKLITSDDSYDNYSELPKSAWVEATDEKIDASSVGRKVLIGGRQIGFLRYFGQTHFGNGIFCGIELEEPVGKHSGTIDGETYFACRHLHGIFAPISKVSLAETVIYNPENDEPIINRRSDPTCSSVSKYTNIGIVNRLSDCTDDRLPNRPLEHLVRESTSYNSKLHEMAQKRKPSSSDSSSNRSFKHIRKLHSHLDGSLLSPDSESSIGILTPNQMPDFTNCSVSIQGSPSDEVVELPMDVAAGATASALPSKSEPDNDLLYDEIFQRDISMVIKEIHKNATDLSSSSEASSPHVSDPLPDDPNSPASIKAKISKRQANALHSTENLPPPSPPSTKSVSFTVQPDEEHEEDAMEEVVEEMIVPHKVSKLRDSGVKPKQRAMLPPSGYKENSILRKSEGDHLNQPKLTPHSGKKTQKHFRHSADMTKQDYSIEEKTADGSWQPGSMTLSSVSLDPGYQGDGEFDVPSEVGSISAGTPTHDAHDSIIQEEIAGSPPPPPLEHSSSATTEPDISLAEDDQIEPVDEAESKVDEAVEQKDNGGGEENDEDDDDDDAASDSSFVTNRAARVIDGRLYLSNRELMLRQQEGGHVRGAVADQHASEMDSSGFYSDLDPRDEDNTRHDAPSLQPLKEAQYDSDVQDNQATTSRQNELPSDSKRTSVSISVQFNASVDLKDDESDDNSASTAQPVENAEPTTSEQTDNSNANPDKKDADSTAGVAKGQESAPNPAPRTYDKPWLSKPTVKKPESKKVFVPPPPPPKPKKNVESKLKAMLAAVPETSAEAEERRAARLAPKKNKWDDVMSKIHEGKEHEKERPKIKEVKSRLMESIKAPQPMSPQAERIRQERRERRERRERQQLATAAAKRSAVRVERKRRCVRGIA